MTGQWKHQVWINVCKKQPGQSISVLWWEFRPLEEMSWDSQSDSGVLSSCDPHYALAPSPVSLLLLLHLCFCCFCAEGCGGEQEHLRRLSCEAGSEGWLSTHWVPAPAVSSWSQWCWGPSSCILLGWSVIASAFCFWDMFPDAMEYLFHQLLNQMTMFSFFLMTMQSPGIVPLDYAVVHLTIFTF